MDYKDNRIPMTLVSGWDGSGKTTLLRHLAKREELQVGVEMIGMGGVLDDLRRDIEGVVSSGLCKRLVVEARGLCQPMRVADMMSMTGLGERVALDTCVTVVDGSRMMDTMYVFSILVLVVCVFLLRVMGDDMDLISSGGCLQRKYRLDFCG